MKSGFYSFKIVGFLLANPGDIKSKGCCKLVQVEKKHSKQVKDQEKKPGFAISTNFPELFNPFFSHNYKFLIHIHISTLLIAAKWYCDCFYLLFLYINWQNILFLSYHSSTR